MRAQLRGLLVYGLILVCSAGARAAEVPRPAPPLSVIAPSGERYSLEAYRGKVVLLEFFLTDCPHCQRSARNIMTFYEELRPKGLEVLAVAINNGANLLIPEFAKRFGVTYPLGVGNRSMLTTFADMSATAQFFVPYVFIIDRKGVIRYEHPGQDAAFHNNEIQNARAEIELLLKERAASAKVAKKATPKS
jgi:peroxiredoxin